MKRENYADNPFAWGRVQRHLHDASYYNPIEIGYRPWWVRLGMWFARWL